MDFQDEYGFFEESGIEADYLYDQMFMDTLYWIQSLPEIHHGQ